VGNKAVGTMDAPKVGLSISYDLNGYWWLHYQHPDGKLEMVMKTTTIKLLDYRRKPWKP
jgi:hypothetical protein